MRQDDAWSVLVSRWRERAQDIGFQGGVSKWRSLAKIVRGNEAQQTAAAVVRKWKAQVNLYVDEEVPDEEVPKEQLSASRRAEQGFTRQSRCRRRGVDPLDSARSSAPDSARSKQLGGSEAATASLVSGLDAEDDDDATGIDEDGDGIPDHLQRVVLLPRKGLLSDASQWAADDDTTADVETGIEDDEEARRGVDCSCALRTALCIALCTRSRAASAAACAATSATAAAVCFGGLCAKLQSLNLCSCLKPGLVSFSTGLACRVCAAFVVVGLLLLVGFVMGAATGSGLGNACSGAGTLGRAAPLAPVAACRCEPSEQRAASDGYTTSQHGVDRATHGSLAVREARDAAYRQAFESGHPPDEAEVVAMIAGDAITAGYDLAAALAASRTMAAALDQGRSYRDARREALPSTWG